MCPFSEKGRRILALLLGMLAMPGLAPAQERPALLGLFPKLTMPPGRIETSSGFDASGASWSAYSAAVISPFGPLAHDGLRLKLLGSFGAYGYDKKRVYCPMSAEEKKRATGANLGELCNDIANRPLTADERADITASIRPLGLTLDGDQIYHQQAYQAMRYDVAVMPGYQVSWQSLVLRAYLGPAMETRSILPADPDKRMGTSWGARTALEAWLRLGSAVWLAADSSYFTGSEAYSGALKLGYQPLSWLALGPELAAFGDVEDDSARAGGFLRLTVKGVETTLSGGIAGGYDGDASAYGSAGVYMRF